MPEDQKPIDATRAKFKCVSVTDHGHAKDAKFHPVTGDTPENKQFWKFTPSGHLELSYINPDVTFVPGQEYYLDITPAQAGAQ